VASSGSNASEGTPHRGVPSVSSLLGRLAALAVIDAVAFAFAYAMIDGGLLLGAVVLLVITALINVVFLVDRLYPIRWVAPGLLLTVLMVVYPLLYTVYISTTNYGGSNILSKDQVIGRLEGRYFTPDGASSLTWRAYRSPSGQFLLWLEDAAGDRFIGDPRSGVAPVDPADPRFGPADPDDGLPTRIGEYEKLDRIEVVRYLTALERLVISGEDAQVRIESLDRAELGREKYTYDVARDAVVDNETGTVYASRAGYFTADDGTRLSPGFTDTVGLANFTRAFTDPNVGRPFLGVFIWTFAFAGLSVLLTFAVGLALALVLNERRLPAKGLFRTLTIIPYTIPGFISALIWVGLLNPLYGPINVALRDVFGFSPPWFSDPTLAKVAILGVNTWLGYPYMLLVSLGALQSIPADLYEAARIDGASAFQQFRRITFPLLLIAIAPLLIGAFAFNFNNFTLIDLITQGGPPTPGAGTPAGQTDILISYTFRLAFAAGRGQDYAFAATVSLLIFVIVAAITIFNFRLSRRLEEMV
jgi:ABC-type sugar transport system permease subunit